MRPVIVVHGGAGTIADALQEAAGQGVIAAATAGFAHLGGGGDAVAAVLAAVEVLEGDPTYNAGHGACMNAEGNFELDAGIMVAEPGGAPRHGAVAAVPDLCNPLQVARAVMDDSRHALLAGAGAVSFARGHGGRFDRDALWTEKAQARWEAARAGGTATGQADTVGAVALDASGRLCVGCSTGGVLGKAVGRVGDSPLPGAGYYADAALGAACATGMGEAIMTRVASFALLQHIAAGQDPDAAAQDVCERTAGASATCGLIAITPAGRVVAAHASPHMSWAVADGLGPVRSGIRR